MPAQDGHYTGSRFLWKLQIDLSSVVKSNAPVAQLDRVLASGARGHRFDKFAGSKFEHPAEQDGP